MTAGPVRYQGNPCRSCVFRTVRTSMDYDNGMLVSCNVPFCVRKAIDVTDRKGPCSRYEKAVP